MRIFVAGATGAVGSRLVSLLVSGGDSITGLARTFGKADALRRAGADAVIADALDGAALATAVSAARPDVVVHEMTAVTGVDDLRRFDRVFAATNRLRTRGLDLLLAAALRAGAWHFLAQSFCGWPFARIGSPVKSEDDGLDPTPPANQRRTLEAIRYLESTVAHADIEGAVLRYGMLYGQDTGVLDRSMVEQVRRRRIPLIGDANGWWSFLHVDDAAAATALAIERGATGIYNIVDDEPAPVRTWLPELATLLGSGPPRRVPKWIARLAVGGAVV